MSTSSQVKRLEVDDEHLLTSVEHQFSVFVIVDVGVMKNGLFCIIAKPV